MRIPYIVQLLIDNDWVVWSWHYNMKAALDSIESDIGNFHVLGDKQYHVRVIHQGKIIYEKHRRKANEKKISRV